MRMLRVIEFALAYEAAIARTENASELAFLQPSRDALTVHGLHVSRERWESV
jgi:hypothetical protein